MDELRKLGFVPGSYVSKNNYFEKQWQQSYWRTNYKRIQTVKAKYDPQRLFFVHHRVGGEDWSADGFSRIAPR